MLHAILISITIIIIIIIIIRQCLFKKVTTMVIRGYIFINADFNKIMKI